MATARSWVAPTRKQLNEGLVRGITAHEYLLGEVWGEPMRTLRNIERRMRIPAWHGMSAEFLYGPPKPKPTPHNWERVRDAHTLTYRRDLPLYHPPLDMLLRRKINHLFWAYPEAAVDRTWELRYRVNYSEQLTGRKLQKPVSYRGLP